MRLTACNSCKAVAVNLYLFVSVNKVLYVIYIVKCAVFGPGTALTTTVKASDSTDYL